MTATNTFSSCPKEVGAGTKASPLGERLRSPTNTGWWMPLQTRMRAGCMCFPRMRIGSVCRSGAFSGAVAILAATLGPSASNPSVCTDRLTGGR